MVHILPEIRFPTCRWKPWFGCWLLSRKSKLRAKVLMGKVFALIYPTDLQLCLFFMTLLVHHHHNQAINFYNGLTKAQVIKFMTARVVTLPCTDVPYVHSSSFMLKIFSNTLDMMKIALAIYMISNIHDKYMINGRNIAISFIFADCCSISCNGLATKPF